MSSAPVRLQRKRHRGFSLQEQSQRVNGLAVVVCTRPGKWSNPWKVGKVGRPLGGKPVLIKTAEQAVSLYRANAYDFVAGYVFRENVMKALTGKNLACYCRLCDAHKDGKPFNVYCPNCAPCHVDVLGCIANGFRCEEAA